VAHQRGSTMGSVGAVVVQLLGEGDDRGAVCLILEGPN
jgi:hypothetical protein